MTEKPKFNYNELSGFLLSEAIRLTDDFIFLMKENDGKNAFGFSGPEEVIELHQKIGKYLEYASIAYHLWEPDQQKEDKNNKGHQ